MRIAIVTGVEPESFLTHIPEPYVVVSLVEFISKDQFTIHTELVGPNVKLPITVELTGEIVPELAFVMFTVYPIWFCEMGDDIDVSNDVEPPPLE